MAATIDSLLKTYGDYAKRQGLKPQYHLTHLMLLISEVAETSLWVSKSKDSTTDMFVNSIQGLSKLYRFTDKNVVSYNDESSPFKLTGETVPLVYLSSLADIIIHLVAYIDGNGWGAEFARIIESKILNDTNTNINESGRFQNNRIGWKVKKQENST